VRFLLDQNVPQEIALVFQALHHQADHATALQLQRASDQDIAVAARGYDVLVTMDLHRQELEWIAVNRAIVDHGIKVLRLRPPKQRLGIRPRPEWFILMVIRQLTFQVEQWIEAFETDSVLVTISREERAFRRRSREDVEASAAAGQQALNSCAATKSAAQNLKCRAPKLALVDLEIGPIYCSNHCSNPQRKREKSGDQERTFVRDLNSKSYHDMS